MFKYIKSWFVKTPSIIVPTDADVELFAEYEEMVDTLTAANNALNWALGALQVEKDKLEKNASDTIVALLFANGGEMTVAKDVIEMAVNADVVLDYHPNEDGSVTISLVERPRDEQS